MLDCCASTPPLPGSAVVAVTTAEPTRDQEDHDPLHYDQWICEPEMVGYEELPLLAEVHRLVDTVIEQAGRIGARGELPGLVVRGVRGEDRRIVGGSRSPVDRRSAPDRS
jgi:hypothetical protein